MDLTWVARRPCYVYADSVFLVVLGIQADLQDLATRDTYYTHSTKERWKNKRRNARGQEKMNPTGQPWVSNSTSRSRYLPSKGITRIRTRAFGAIDIGLIACYNECFGLRTTTMVPRRRMNFYLFSIALEFANGIELVTETASFRVTPFPERFIYYVERYRQLLYP